MKDSPLRSPLCRAIDRFIVREGGELVRYKMSQGKAQFWVVRGTGETVVAGNLDDLANALGARSKMSKDMVSLDRAAKLTGYSASAVSMAIKQKTLPCVREGRRVFIDRVEALAWAEKKKAEGGYGQQPRRSPKLRAGRPVRAGINGTPEPVQKSARLVSEIDTLRRLYQDQDRIEREIQACLKTMLSKVGR